MLLEAYWLVAACRTWVQPPTGSRVFVRRRYGLLPYTPDAALTDSHDASLAQIDCVSAGQMNLTCVVRCLRTHHHDSIKAFTVPVSRAGRTPATSTIDLRLLSRVSPGRERRRSGQFWANVTGSERVAACVTAARRRCLLHSNFSY